MASSGAVIVACTDACSPAFMVEMVLSSNSTSQSGGVEALRLTSVRSAVPLFLTTKSITLSLPALRSVLKLPEGVVISTLYDPVMTASKVNSPDVLLVAALIGISYVSAFTFLGGVTSTVISLDPLGSTVADVIESPPDLNVMPHPSDAPELSA